jgi:Zn-dependent protease with chaperone function
LYETLDDDEIQCVMGHELGHVMSGHALYTTLLMFLLRMWFLFLSIPGGMYALLMLQAALLEWSRKAELTSDRAGLLVVQNPDVAYRVDMKLAGGKRVDQMSLEAFLRQAEEFEAGGDILGPASSRCRFCSMPAIPSRPCACASSTSG